MLLVGCCHLIANMNIYCAPLYLLSWPIVGGTISQRIVLNFLSPHINITTVDRFFPLVFVEGCIVVVLLKLYMSTNHFVALHFCRFPLALVVLSYLDCFFLSFALDGPHYAFLYMLLMRFLASSRFSLTYSVHLVGACFMLTGAMLIVYLCFFTITDVLPSVILHDALVASSCNACLRHVLSSVCTSDGP
ncbi:unnamed protein product [Lactuca saligna]|uniref:Uncharacterized protein n=1 Tax=Lactuca saligna TaxID=75948 RepID=A0AA35ZSW2_LACSI|nr:unnamed protein product [Lactuca saligna]